MTLIDSQSVTTPPKKGAAKTQQPKTDNANSKKKKGKSTTETPPQDQNHLLFLSTFSMCHATIPMHCHCCAFVHDCYIIVCDRVESLVEFNRFAHSVKHTHQAQ